jgi:hypothetical protein
MKHTFKPGAVSLTECKTCQRDIVAHSDFARCEVCKKFPTSVNLIGDYLMCPMCEESERIAKDDASNQRKQDRIENVESARYAAPDAQLQKMAKDTAIETISTIGGDGNPLTDLPMDGNEFFNAETLSLVAVEKRVYADETIPNDKKAFEYARQSQERHKHLQHTLVEAIGLLKEVRSRLSASQRNLNVLVDKLRADEKAKLKIVDINYAPVPAPKKVKARMTQKDKVIEDMARTIYAPQLSDAKRNASGYVIWDELSPEQRTECLDKARNNFNNIFSSTSAAVKVINASDNANAGKETIN